MLELNLIHARYSASHLVVLASVGDLGTYVVINMDYDGDVGIDFIRALPTREEFVGICLLITSDQGSIAELAEIQWESVHESFVQRVLMGALWSFASQISKGSNTDES